MAKIRIRNLEELGIIGSLLARNIPVCGMPSLFLRGSLGAGKTALARAIVSCLPGAEKAECGSPSFNIYNSYPTYPPVLHCDLYRCGQELPEEILEALDRKDQLLLVEWAEFFPVGEIPDDYLDIILNMDNDGRLLEVTAYGSESARLLNLLLIGCKQSTIPKQSVSD